MEFLLPLDVHRYIFNYLDTISQFRIRSVCKRFYNYLQIHHFNTYEHALLLQKFGNDEVLAKMTHLRSLYLDLRSLYLDNSYISTFSHLTNLKQLALFGNYHQKNIDRLYNLEELYLNNVLGIRDLNHLSKLTYLELVETKINDANIEKLTGIRSLQIIRYCEIKLFSRLTNLETLIISDDRTEFNNDQLSCLTNLKYLDASMCPNISIVTDLTKLEFLDIRRIGNIRKIIDLRNLYNLTKLVADRTDLNLEDISHLIQLEELSVRSVSTLTAINCMKNLKFLDNCNGHLPNAEIANLTKLLSLDVRGNFMVTNLNNLYQLEKLVLGSQPCLTNHIISNLTKLTHLEMDHKNFIADLSSFTNLKVLIGGYCAGFKQTASLSKLTNLHTLDVRYWKISSLNHLKNLTKLDISDCQIIEELNNLTKLRILKMNGTCHIPNLNHLVNLTYLEARNICVTYESIKKLTNLEYLYSNIKFGNNGLSTLKRLRIFNSIRLS